MEYYFFFDRRIKVFHKENKGVSSARNFGLSIANGEWIVFIDSDDWLENNHISSLLAKADKTVDLIVCGYTDVLKDSRKQHIYQEISYIGKEQITNFLATGDLLKYMIPWDKVFRNKIIQENKLRFNTSLSLSVNGIASTGKVTYIHDGTDSQSLSNKSHPYEMLVNRCKLLYPATLDLLKHYSITGDNAYSFISYYWGIFKFAIFNVLYSTEVYKALKLQRQLYKTCFDRSWLSSCNPKTHALIASREDWLIENGYFLLLHVYIRGRNAIKKHCQ